MDPTVTAALIGLGGVIFTGLFGIYMHKLGTKSEKTKVLMNKRIELYVELSSKLDSLKRSLNIFTTLRLRNALSKSYSTSDLEKDLAVFDNYVSEYYEYFKEHSGIIQLLSSKKIVEQLEGLKDDIINCRDEYQILIEGDWGILTQDDYLCAWLKAVYETDANMRKHTLPAISNRIDEIILLLSKALNIRSN